MKVITQSIIVAKRSVPIRALFLTLDFNIRIIHRIKSKTKMTIPIGINVSCNGGAYRN